MGFNFVDIIVLSIIFALTIFVFKQPFYFFVLFIGYFIFKRIAQRQTAV